MKHSVPATINRPGCSSFAACVHCRKFGAKDGEEGCGGEEEFEALVARLEAHLREHPLRGPVLLADIALLKEPD